MAGFGRATHIGVHSLRLDSLRVMVPSPEQVSIAAAENAEGGSLLLMINPGRDHGALVMRGVASGGLHHGILVCHRVRTRKPW